MIVGLRSKLTHTFPLLSSSFLAKASEKETTPRGKAFRSPVIPRTHLFSSSLLLYSRQWHRPRLETSVASFAPLPFLPHPCNQSPRPGSALSKSLLDVSTTPLPTTYLLSPQPVSLTSPPTPTLTPAIHLSPHCLSYLPQTSLLPKHCSPRTFPMASIVYQRKSRLLFPFGFNKQLFPTS